MTRSPCSARRRPPSPESLGDDQAFLRRLGDATRDLDQ